ncbi:MAG: hypothetical protein DWQ47_02135 [Acidobacteria bacterium]|nr:MAG: hypothetical protein DWQ32_05685 [Acidobacteriota bacterium]REK01220.1 MAG: hypothetical protein DWQ38_02120 [Acidobacteriota bacterium]REK14176.1 MAG: hypothetical protein DWQ43_11375 [Acidobacteriota bacterium]REK44891.1 MAG: hypothetical protein DWQ47_02135 [Acidobacteriota bacterium]
MRFDGKVQSADRERISQALDDIEKHGDRFHKRLSRFIRSSDLALYVDLAENVRGSGSVSLNGQWGARLAVGAGDLRMFDAARHVRLNIARETIDTGGQRGIEGTLVHEGKHALDFSKMLSSFSAANGRSLFNPTAYQREYSAHLTSAFYLRLRGGEYADEGIDLGLLEVRNGELSVSVEGIRQRLRRNYGLTPETPGQTLNHSAYPKIRTPEEMWFGIV